MRDAGTLTRVHREFQLLLTCTGSFTCIRTGIGPEVFAWKTVDGNYTGIAPTVEKEAYYQVIAAHDALSCKTTELIIRNTDTIHTATLLITTSGPRFWNRTSSPGVRLVT